MTPFVWIGGQLQIRNCLLGGYHWYQPANDDLYFPNKPRLA